MELNIARQSLITITKQENLYKEDIWGRNPETEGELGICTSKFWV